MMNFTVEHKGVSKFLLGIDKEIQKGMRKAVNAGTRAAHREGYKILSKSYKIDKDEYKKRKTSVKSIKASDFTKHRDLSTNIRARTKGIGLLRFAVSKKRTPMKDKRKGSRRKVIITVAGKSKVIKGAFIARPRKSKGSQVFTKHKKNGEWKWKREETKSFYELMTEEETQGKLESAADRAVLRILKKEIDPLL